MCHCYFYQFQTFSMKFLLRENTILLCSYTHFSSLHPSIITNSRCSINKYCSYTIMTSIHMVHCWVSQGALITYPLYKLHCQTILSLLGWFSTYLSQSLLNSSLELQNFLQYYCSHGQMYHLYSDPFPPETIPPRQEFGCTGHVHRLGAGGFLRKGAYGIIFGEGRQTDMFIVWLSNVRNIQPFYLGPIQFLQQWILTGLWKEHWYQNQCFFFSFVSCVPESRVHSDSIFLENKLFPWKLWFKGRIAWLSWVGRRFQGLKLLFI